MIVNCSGDIVNNTDPGLNTSVIYWKEPIFLDNDVVSSNVSTFSPGDAFELGNSTVIYNISDSSGNMDSCSFLVTVVGKQTL